MPTITRYRRWCKKCENFTIHDRKDDKFICECCDTVYTDVYLRDIPWEKVEEQRKRYTEKEGKEWGKLFEDLYATPEQQNMKFYFDMMKPPGSDIEICESDAGLEQKRERNRKRRAQKLSEYREQKEKDLEEIKKYKDLNRNDKCACGSKKKYKRCCLERIKKLRNKYQV